MRVLCEKVEHSKRKEMNGGERGKNARERGRCIIKLQYFLLERRRRKEKQGGAREENNKVC